ncbi:MAG: sulfite exporter TauE/SafE family protein [Burkholderiaceae bacterium]
MPEMTLFSALMAGLLGGVHCAAMCGPVAASLSALQASKANTVTKATEATQATQADKVTPGLFRVIPIAVTNNDSVIMRDPAVELPDSGATKVLGRLKPHMAYSTGRVMSYTVLGAVAGALGTGLWQSATWLPVQVISLGLMAASLIIVGLYLLGWRVIADASEVVGRVLWRFLQPTAARSLRHTGGSLHLVGAGAIWGLLPCGMVYTVLLMALASADLITGASIMLMFGLGTVPNLLLIGGFANYLTSLQRSRRLRQIVGGAIVAYGVLMLLRLGHISDVVSMGRALPLPA